MTTNNIVKFPKTYVNHRSKSPEPPKEEEIEDRKLTIKLTHIEEAIAQVSPMILDCFHAMAFDLYDHLDNRPEEKYIKDLALVRESLRSVLLRYYDMDHYCQDMAEELYHVDEQGIVTVKNNSIVLDDNTTLEFHPDSNNEDTITPS